MKAGKKNKKKATNRATAFSNDLRRILRHDHPRLTKKLGVIEWRKNWSVKGLGQTVDVVGLKKDGRPAVLIEVELLREDPASNVAKIWKWAAGSNQSKFVLVQAFSRAYRTRKQERKKLARFLGKRMAKELSNATYIPLNLRYNPRPGGKVGAGARCRQAKLLAKRLVMRGSDLESGVR